MKIQSLGGFSVFTKNNLAVNNNKNKINNYNTKPLALESVSFGYRDDIKPELTNAEACSIFEAIGVKTRVELDMTISLYKYVPNAKQIKKLEALGINEETLFQNVTKIRGSMDLTHSNLKSLQNIREIGGFLTAGPKLESLGELRGIRLNFDTLGSKIKKPEKLKYIGGDFLRDTTDTYKEFSKICIEGNSLVYQYNERNGKYKLVNYY